MSKAQDARPANRNKTKADNIPIEALEKEIAETPVITSQTETPVDTSLTETSGNTSLTEAELNKIRKTLERATLDFDFEGYLRAGYGVDDSGNAMSTFKAPVAEAKYRLGNEAETYLETAFIATANPEETGDAKFETVLRLAYVNSISNSDAFDPTTSSLARQKRIPPIQPKRGEGTSRTR